MVAPLISIITVCYNAKSDLQKTIESVRRQTFDNFEYLVVDGASTDGSVELLASTEFDKLRWISEPDKGLYDAMNKAIDQAQGEYLWFVNAGDTIRTSGITEDIATAIRLAPEVPSVVYGDTMWVDNQGADLQLRPLRPPRHLTAGSFRRGMLVCHQAFMPRRDLAPHYNIRYRFSADFDWCVRILEQSSRTLFVSEVWVNYLVEGMTTRNHKKSLFERFLIMKEHYGTFSTVIFHIGFLFRYLWHTLRQKYKSSKS